jgi:hypothetical protein
MRPPARLLTSNPADLLAGIREARHTVSGIEAALQQPGLDVWDKAAPGLEHAAAILADVERSLAGTGSVSLDCRAEIKAEVQALGRDIRRINALMRAAAEFYTGWAQLLSATLGGYTQAGTVVTLAAPARLTVRG